MAMLAIWNLVLQGRTSCFPLKRPQAYDEEPLRRAKDSGPNDPCVPGLFYAVFIRFHFVFISFIFTYVYHCFIIVFDFS